MSTNRDADQKAKDLLAEHDRLLALPGNGDVLRGWLAKLSDDDMHSLAYALGRRSLGLLDAEKE